MKRIISAAIAVFLISGIIFTHMPIPVSADTSQELTGLYDDSNYTVKSNGSYTYEFDGEAKTAVCTGGQTKALLNYAPELTDIETSVTIASNVPATGLIYAGVGLLVQQSDFSATNFNGSEYLVYINRSASSLDKLSLVVRVTNAGKNKKDFKTTYTVSGDTSLKIVLKAAISEGNIVVNLAYTDGTKIADNVTYSQAELNSAAGVDGYSCGGVSLVANGKHIFSDFSIVNKGAAVELPSSGDEEDDEYKDYDITTNSQALTGLYSSKNWTPYTAKADQITINKKAETISFTNTQNKAYLNYTAGMTNFDASVDIKSNASGLVYGGMSFRIQTGSYDRAAFGSEGYSVILVRSSNIGYDNVQIIVRHGTASSAAYNLYAKEEGVLDKDKTDYTLTLKISLKNRELVASAYDGSRQLLAVNYDLRSEFRDYDYYPSGAVGLLTNGNMTFSNLSVMNTGTSITLPSDSGDEEDDRSYTAARESSRVTPTTGNSVKITDIEAGHAGSVTGAGVTAYSKDFDNYTYYSSSASTSLKLSDNVLTSNNGSTHRALLDNVTAEGFHADFAVKICEEGTLSAGIVFRVQEVEKGTRILGSNDMEGYAVILYKTPGSTGDHARVVMCVYKYGKINGTYTYLGTVGSKASTVPLTGCSDSVTAAAGKELVLSVNVVGNELTACYYNRKKPSLISDTMVVDLKNVTDVETNNPSYGNIYYKSGQIGIQVKGKGTVTGFAVSEPVVPSGDVTDLSSLSSYTVYSSGKGAVEEDGYITATSSGTKKIMVNNLTVSDFTSSLDMTIDENGNLSTGIFFRVTDAGNANDAANGWALVARRNYSSMGEKNPNRIDLVLYKWGYLGEKLSYLGEVAREVYQGEAALLNGKEAGTELTLVMKVEGSSIDATLYRTDDLTKNATFSSNLKFVADKETDIAAYNESGAIGIFMSNCVNDPLTTGKIRNFRVDDGSGVLVKTGSKASGALVGPTVSILEAGASKSADKKNVVKSAVPGTGDYGAESVLTAGLTAIFAGIVIAAEIIRKRRKA